MWEWSKQENLYLYINSLSMKKKWFTLLEVIVSITIFFVLLVVIVGLYTKMLRLKYNIQARQSLIQNSYDAMEKINLLLKDYTIDYEEYFNRRNSGCSGNNAGQWFMRNTTLFWHCSNFTADGNGSYDDSGAHTIYYCSSLNPSNTTNVIPSSAVQQGSGCVQTGPQSFWEYYRQFRDVKNDVDNVSGAVGDADDVRVMKGPIGILDNNNVKELYLISQDGKQRLWIRKALIEQWDRDKNGITGDVDSDKLYTLQILKLRWFDAGSHHDFDVNNSSGVYDSNIDTRACDYAQWFICNGSWISNLYSWYKLPANTDDGRVNLFDQDLTVSNRNLSISPTKDPDYALAQNETQINPYFTVSLTNKLYGRIWYKRLGLPSLDDFELSLQTSFSTKNFYTK